MTWASALRWRRQAAGEAAVDCTPRADAISSSAAVSAVRPACSRSSSPAAAASARTSRTSRLYRFAASVTRSADSRCLASSSSAACGERRIVSA
ncbi:MAG: hypothetical protein ACRDPF_05250 [Streptosporangiaceae bacterium]